MRFLNVTTPCEAIEKPHLSLVKLSHACQTMHVSDFTINLRDVDKSCVVHYISHCARSLGGTGVSAPITGESQILCPKPILSRTDICYKEAANG